MTDIFDDPELRAAMAAAGIVHRPGMAAELLGELGPLLADEGIDLATLDASDLDALNAALAHATDRYNMELFTPVRERRTQALAVLRQFAEALGAGDEHVAREVLAAVGPEPGEGLPAASHVIGAGLGLLDTWHSDRALGEVVLRARIPQWRGPGRRAARAILARARDGRAFDALGELHQRHHGLAIFEGTALAVAACLAAVAESRGTTVALASGKLLSGDEAGPPRPTARPPAGRSPVELHAVGAPPGPNRAARRRMGRQASAHHGPRDQQRSDRITQRDFDAWLRRQPSIAAPDVDTEAGMFESLVGLARRVGIDPNSPQGLVRLADELLGMDEGDQPGITAAAMSVLDDYVHFRLETAADLEAWEDAHAAVEDALDEAAGGPNALVQAVRAADLLDIDERRAALAATRAVQMVPRLLDWIGRTRPTSPSGGVRRTDIAEAAAMLGVSAVGVNKLPTYRPDDPPFDEPDVPIQAPATIFAMSMGDVPLLAPWWEALLATGIIEATTTRVRPGPMAGEWLAEDLPPLDLAETVVGIFIAEALTQDLRRWGIYEDRVVTLTMTRLVQAITLSDLTDPEADSPLVQLLSARVLRKLEHLQLVGLLEPTADGGFTVPPLLRGVVARGLLATAALLESLATE